MWQKVLNRTYKTQRCKKETMTSPNTICTRKCSIHHFTHSLTALLSKRLNKAYKILTETTWVHIQYSLLLAINLWGVNEPSNKQLPWRPQFYRRTSLLLIPLKIGPCVTYKSNNKRMLSADQTSLSPHQKEKQQLNSN